jgi:hypothetical protein
LQERNDWLAASQVSVPTNKSYVLCRSPLIDIVPRESRRHQVRKLIRRAGEDRAVQSGTYECNAFGNEIAHTGSAQNAYLY